MARFAYGFERPVVELEERLEELKKHPSAAKADIAEEIKYLEDQVDKLRIKIYSNLSAWQKVQIARHPLRPRALDYISMIFNNFIELHGDRLFADDRSIVSGLAYLDKEKVAIVGQQKGRNVKENVVRNFGMPHPEGYRKALRIMKLAEKFSVPLICFIDTPGAYPGIEAEERGQALAIANNIMEMSRLKVPIIVVDIGEGGSGGALALGVGDRTFMLENAYYSVITPEGCAAILWHDENKAPQAAEALKLTADALLKLKLIDGIIKEPLGGAHRDHDAVIYRLRNTLIEELKELKSLSVDDLVEVRYERLRRIGHFDEEKLKALEETKKEKPSSKQNSKQNQLKQSEILTQPRKKQLVDRKILKA